MSTTMKSVVVSVSYWCDKVHEMNPHMEYWSNVYFVPLSYDTSTIEEKRFEYEGKSYQISVGVVDLDDHVRDLDALRKKLENPVS